jgi:hypothetical protein
VATTSTAQYATPIKTQRQRPDRERDMIVNSAHLTTHLWFAAALGAFGLVRLAIECGARRGWSHVQHALAGATAGMFVLGNMLFTAWGLAPTPAEARKFQDCAAHHIQPTTRESAPTRASQRPDFLQWPAMFQ